MYIKSFFKIVSFVVTPFLILNSLNANPPLSQKSVAITQIAEHPAADAVREGILAALKDSGYKDGKDFKIYFENAHGSPVTAAQIANKFVSLNPSVLVPISTTSAQAIVKADKSHNIPIVFAAVTDPIAAGLVSNLERPGGHITGITDATPVKRQMELFTKILPNMKKIGILYNPGDNSSLTPVKEAKEVCKQLKISVVEASAFKTSDVPTAMKQLAGRGVDAVFVPLDNTVLAAMDAVLKIGFEHNTPVFSSDSDSVSQGVLASSGYTHFDTGFAAGMLVVKVLEGTNPGDIPVGNAEDLNVYVNTRSAQLLGIDIPDDILKEAKRL